MYEITFHSRGGQGAKSAVMLLGKIFSQLDKNIQAFPEYGPEREGAPVRTFLRISEEEINIKSSIESNDMMIFLDDSLFSEEKIDLLKENGILIINTGSEIQLKRKDVKLYLMDITKVALKIINRNVPNIGLMAYFPFLMKEINEQKFKKDLEELLSHKYSKEIVEKNMKTYDEIKKQIGEKYGKKI